MSTVDSGDARPVDGVAGFLAAAAIAVAAIGIAYRPVRLIPVAVVLALAAAGMSARHQKLAVWAVVICAVCWVVGMTVAIWTNNALY
jgi:hypothetical protein